MEVKENKFKPKGRKGIKNKYPINYKRNHFYDFYKKTYQYCRFISKFSESSDLTVDYKTYSKVIDDMFKMINHQIIYEAKIFKLPLRLGSIGIKKKKMNFKSLINTGNLKLDYKASQESGIKVFHTNDHSDGYRIKWCWFRRYCNIPGKTWYKFVPGFHNKREASKAFRNKVSDYTI